MSNFKDSPHFEIHDDYYTPRSAWENIASAIPKDKIIWEACMLGAKLSKSPQYLKELTPPPKGVVAYTFMDCLDEEPLEWDMIITNIPFDIKLKVPILERFISLDKPFILIMNSLNTFSKYFHKIFSGKEKDLQIITPSSKINFDKLEGGVLKPTNKCSFYCVYVCYKVDLSPEELWRS